MNFFRRSGILALGALILLLVLSWRNILPFDVVFRPFATYIIAPLSRIIDEPTNNLAQENKELREVLKSVAGTTTIEQLQKAQRAEEATIQTWAELRSFPKPLLASILTRVEENGQLFFLLNRGSDDGVVPYATVISGNGILVGRITTVRKRTAFLRLLTAPTEHFSLIREGGDTAMGITEGKGNDERLHVNFIPKELTLSPNETFLTSGLDVGVPRGLLVGTVRETFPLENSPWQQATLIPFNHPASLHTVAILPFSQERY